MFDPSMPVGEIQATLDRTHAQQIDNEMGSERYAYLFKPGTYGTAEQPLLIKVGYYTEVAGLGDSPTDVTINGKIEIYNRCLEGGTGNCIALVNFWRTLSNLTLNIARQDGCRGSANFWAVSQAVSLRRVNVLTGEGVPAFSLMDYCTAGPQYASGGFIAASRFGGVVNGSQQQWLTRNSEVGSWSNGVWNRVFAGVEGAPAETFPTPNPYTVLETTPVSREKPFLFLNDRGRYYIHVPFARRGTRGITWENGMTPGRSLPLSTFFVAKPSDSVRTLNNALACGFNLLLTPGMYNVPGSILVKRANTVVLGLSHATLTSVRGAVPLKRDDEPGIVVAGVTVDAGTVNSPVLLQVGKRRGRDDDRDDRRGGSLNPTTLSDVYFRVGGPHVGKTKVALEVNSDNVLLDHLWVWRADRGIEGFKVGVNGDTDRWRTNTAKNGAVINGDFVTATGLFVEHFQEYNTVWNGENGTTILYQNELPYDPPTQADWMNGDTEGWAGYKVGDDVKTHTLYGGVYVFNQNNPDIHTENGFEVPNTPGVRLEHIMTVNLSAGTIDHVVNGVGGAAIPEAGSDPGDIGQPVYITRYP